MEYYCCTMTTKQLYILLILIADVIAVLLDQLVHKKLAGYALGWSYYLYLVFATLLFSLVIYALE